MTKELIGQKQLKKRLQFYTDSKKATGVIPFLMFNGAKGLGKTEFAKQFATTLGKKMIEINCSTIRNGEQFFEQIFIPAIMDKDITILFDEAHALPNDLVMAFLTIFNVEGAKTKRFDFGENSFVFEFERQTFMFATTELDKLFPPFRDRLTVLDFEPYSTEELGRIMSKKIDWVTFKDDVMTNISSTLRGNARSAIKRALEVKAYCEVYNQSTFGEKDWAKLCKLIGILPHGITNIELQVMQILRERGACTLQMISAVTGMSRTAIQRDAEVYLLKEGFVKIDGKRTITNKGVKVLEKIQ
jgi:Holliday junction resolvasome RuvABC ATP-dependent DNA helicase subunit